MTDAPEAPTESEPERGARRPRVGDGGSPVGSTLAIVLAVIAVVAGFLILRAITDDDGDGGSVIPEPAASAAPDGSTGGSTPTPGTGVTPTAVAPTAPPPTKTGATVLVANVSGISGSAGTMATALTTDGYTVGEPTNGTGEQLATSVVYYVDGNPQALAVATTLAGQILGVPALPMPVPPPVESGLGDATVVLMLGTDAAGKVLADLAVAAPAVQPPTAVGVTTTTIAG